MDHRSLDTILSHVTFQTPSHILPFTIAFLKKSFLDTSHLTIITLSVPCSTTNDSYVDPPRRNCDRHMLICDTCMAAHMLVRSFMVVLTYLGKQDYERQQGYWYVSGFSEGEGYNGISSYLTIVCEMVAK